MAKAKRVGIKPETVRDLCLKMPEATEKPHFDRTSFRVKNKIFVTLGPDENRCVVKLTGADREALLSTHSDLFLDVGWASQGWLGVQLDRIAPAMLADLLASAWRNVAPKLLVREFAQTPD